MRKTRPHIWIGNNVSSKTVETMRQKKVKYVQETRTMERFLYSIARWIKLPAKRLSSAVLKE